LISTARYSGLPVPALSVRACLHACEAHLIRSCRGPCCEPTHCLHPGQRVRGQLLTESLSTATQNFIAVPCRWNMSLQSPGFGASPRSAWSRRCTRSWSALLLLAPSIAVSSKINRPGWPPAEVSPYPNQDRPWTRPPSQELTSCQGAAQAGRLGKPLGLDHSTGARELIRATSRSARHLVQGSSNM
jgi:hypothetical protein